MRWTDFEQAMALHCFAPLRLMLGVRDDMRARRRTRRQYLVNANTLLPRGEAPQAHPGYESESALAPSLLTIASERAAARNNEV